MTLSLLKEILSIPSPTQGEEKKLAFVKQWFEANCPGYDVLEYGYSAIFQKENPLNKPHIALVGHSDTVPAFFEPYIQGDHLHGSGASDMQAGFVAFMQYLSQHQDDTPYHYSFILYAKEEDTPLEQNGLYELIQAFPAYFKGIDLAIVGEPTNNAIQIGCVGSAHFKVQVHGQPAHSARPWNGENALYKAIPFIQHIANYAPKPHQVFGVEFKDVLSITESRTDLGRTSVPGLWEANVNFRFAPTRDAESARQEAEAYLKETAVPLDLTCTDIVYAGSVVETPLFKEVVAKLGCPVEAKQAWTDVAQFGQLGIPAFNFGPGYTEQAHKPNEYVSISAYEYYLTQLELLSQAQ